MSKKKRTILIIVVILVSLLVLIGAAGGLLVGSYLSKVQYDTGEQVVEIEDIQQPALTDEEILQELLAEEPISEEADSAQEEIDALEEQMASQITENSGNTDDILKCPQQKRSN